MSAAGTWNGEGERNAPSLTLTEDGRLTGTDGCNRLLGSWSESEGVVSFNEVATTMMLCRGVDDWLSKLATARIDGDAMTVLNAEGTEIGTLTRHDEFEALSRLRETL